MWPLNCLSVLLLFPACQDQKSPLPYYTEATFTPIFLEDEKKLEQLIPHQVGGFQLLNQEGKHIDQEVVNGKIHVANFFFTSCVSICPRMTENMLTVAEALQEESDFHILSFTVTPWWDSPEKLKSYAKAKQLPLENWSLLTGKQSEIYQLARTSYFAEEELGLTKDSTEFLHTEHFILVDRQQRIRGIYNGTLPLEMKQLIADAKMLLKR